MSQEVSDKPRGLFRRDTAGRTTTPTTIEIERGRIRFFADVLGERNPLHSDIEAARAAGHPDLLAPPSFFMVIEAEADRVRAARGEPSVLEMIGSDFRFLLHGSERYEYRGPVYAGDTVSHHTEVVDFYDKKGGAMEFVTLRSLVSHPERGVVISATRTLLHRFG